MTTEGQHHPPPPSPQQQRRRTTAAAAAGHEDIPTRSTSSSASVLPCGRRDAIVVDRADGFVVDHSRTTTRRYYHQQQQQKQATRHRTRGGGRHRPIVLGGTSAAVVSSTTAIPTAVLLLLGLLLLGSPSTVCDAWMQPLPQLQQQYRQQQQRQPHAPHGTMPVTARRSLLLPLSAAAATTRSTTTETLTIPPISSLDGTVTLPGSKSLSNRCLLLAALAQGSTTVNNLLDSDDIRYMLEALQTLQVPVTIHSSDSVTVTGQAGPIPFPKKKTSSDDTAEDDDHVVTLFLGNAGTAMRPLAAALCFDGSNSDLSNDNSKNSKKKTYILDGVERMRERPIADLVDGLTQLGADVTCVAETGCPPVTIQLGQDQVSTIQKDGGSCHISGKMSSQFLSALLMAAPLSDGDITITIKDELISAPYVALTLNLMNRFGVHVDVQGELDGGTPSFYISKDQTYKSPGSILVEGDASSASYFVAGAAITGGTVTVRGCGSDSVQGDVAFANVMEQMGATVTWTPDSITVTRDPNVQLKGVDVDCGKIPDAAMTLAVAALFADGPTTIRNVYSWRLKETERMKAIVAECTKLGAVVEEYRDYCVIHPPPNHQLNDNVLIETYDDHRMAMTFSLAACGGVTVIINDPKCTAKTFPTYFDMLESLVTRRSDDGSTKE